MKKRNSKHEDKIMKKAMSTFRELCLEIFNIEGKIISSGPTESIELNIKDYASDYTFLLDNNTFIHFEFQTTYNGIDDLRRFKLYEAYLEHTEKKSVVTYVIYSNGIANPINEYKCGINTYSVNTICMGDRNWDELYNGVKSKLAKNQIVNKVEFVELVFGPIMNSSLPKGDRIEKVINLRFDMDASYREDILAICYAFADKFLSGDDFEKIVEVLKMTEIGKKIVEETEKEKAIEFAQGLLLEGFTPEKASKFPGIKGVLSLDEIKKLKETLN